VQQALPQVQQVLHQVQLQQPLEQQVLPLDQ